MRLLVDVLELILDDVGVDLGRAEILVAQQFLHAAQVGAVVKQMGRERMAQLVRREVGGQAAFDEVALQVPLERAGGQPFPETVQEDRTLLLLPPAAFAIRSPPE